MCRDVVTSLEELLCACVGCRPGYQGWAGQGRGQDQKTREQAASLHQPHRGTCTPHTCQPGVSSHSFYLVSTCLYRLCWGTYISCSINCVPSPSETPATAQLHETGTRALLSSICRVQILFRILISLSENEQNNKSCCIPLQST